MLKTTFDWRIVSWRMAIPEVPIEKYGVCILIQQAGWLIFLLQHIVRFTVINILYRRCDKTFSAIKLYFKASIVYRSLFSVMLLSKPPDLMLVVTS